MMRIFKYDIWANSLSEASKEEADNFRNEQYPDYYIEGIPGKMIERSIIVQLHNVLFFTEDSINEFIEVVDDSKRSEVLYMLKKYNCKVDQVKSRQTGKTRKKTFRKTE